MERIYDYLIVSEADGVLTVVSHLGGPTYPITSDWAIIEYSLYSPEQFAQQFHVLPEPEPEP